MSNIIHVSVVEFIRNGVIQTEKFMAEWEQAAKDGSPFEVEECEVIYGHFPGKVSLEGLQAHYEHLTGHDATGDCYFPVGSFNMEDWNYDR